MTLETVIIPVKWEEEESDFGGIFGLFVRHAAATAAAFLQFLDSENQSEVERIRDGPRPSSLPPPWPSRSPNTPWRAQSSWEN